MYNLLIAEDEPMLRNAVKEYFGRRQFEIWEAEDGQQAIKLLKERDFDIILLDIMMPKADGFQVCRTLRRRKDTPVIFLTARTAEEDQLRGFQLKADDYVTKPFSLPVLHARVCALLQRYKGGNSSRTVLTAKGIRVDLESREVTVDGKTVAMQPKVYALLVYFLENKNRILTRQQLLDQVWGEDVFCYDRAVDSTIKKLRQALGDRAGCIRTIIKVGYRFQEEEDE